MWFTRCGGGRRDMSDDGFKVEFEIPEEDKVSQDITEDACECGYCDGMRGEADFGGSDDADEDFDGGDASDFSEDGESLDGAGDAEYEDETAEDAGGSGKSIMDYQIEAEVYRLERDEAAGKAKEYLEAAQRLQAEFDNYRKRTAETGKRLKEDGIIEAVNKMLTVYDTLKRAVTMTEDIASKNGMRMVLKQFTDTLAEMNVHEIEALGKEFDPMLHEAVMRGDAGEAEAPGTVIEVFVDGFMIGERVLRHSMVKVAG